MAIAARGRLVVLITGMTSPPAAIEAFLAEIAAAPKFVAALPEDRRAEILTGLEAAMRALWTLGDGDIRALGFCDDVLSIARRDEPLKQKVEALVDVFANKNLPLKIG